MFDNRRTDAGETLVETLVSIALLGIASAAVIGSVTMGVRAATINVGNGTNQNLARNWAEQVEAMPYVLCAQTTPDVYEDVYVYVVPPDLPAGTTLSITTIQYWDGDSYEVSTPGCDSSDKGLQKIALRAVSTNSTGTQQFTLVIVKRRE